jgi:hypothetical protein
LRLCAAYTFGPESVPEKTEASAKVRRLLRRDADRGGKIDEDTLAKQGKRQRRSGGIPATLAESARAG